MKLNECRFGFDRVKPFKINSSDQGQLLNDFAHTSDHSFSADAVHLDALNRIVDLEFVVLFS